MCRGLITNHSSASIEQNFPPYASSSLHAEYNRVIANIVDDDFAIELVDHCAFTTANFTQTDTLKEALIVCRNLVGLSCSVPNRMSDYSSDDEHNALPDQKVAPDGWRTEYRTNGEAQKEAGDDQEQGRKPNEKQAFEEASLATGTDVEGCQPVDRRGGPHADMRTKSATCGADRR